MKKITLNKLALFVFSGLIIFLLSCEKDKNLFQNENNNSIGVELEFDVSNSYIVIFNDNFSASNELDGIKTHKKRNEVMKSYLNRFLRGQSISNSNVNHVYSTVYMGFNANLSHQQLERLKSDPMVKSVIKDDIINLGKPEKKPKPTPEPEPEPTPDPQVIPWGINRIGGATIYTGTSKAWIIDTGIDFDHPDLNVDQASSVNLINSRKSADDDNGHGTHCAGIIAAKDNNEGVIGVAAGATVVSIKVLDRRGSGTWSGIIAGMDYVAATASIGDVANISLGGSANSAVDEAVIALGNANIKVAIAAGNESTNANSKSPARANGINLFTVSAMDINDEFAYFSNYSNPPVDYCAPGVGIYSCYKNGEYTSLNGTSMAAPHIAGLLLLGNISSDGNVKLDPDGNPDPIAHK